jgi:putative ABC transport system substrate-binding protein
VWAQAGHMPIVGVVSAASREPRLSDAFLGGLGEHGYVEGQNIRVEFRYADGRLDRVTGLISDLLDRGIGVFVAAGGNAARLIQQSTDTPIVFVGTSDPVGSGLVASLAPI